MTPVRRGAPRSETDPPALWWSLGLVCMCGLAVRAVFLAQPMRQDEADTVVLFALTPVRHILTDTSIPNNHMLHSLLVKASIGLLGLDARVVRLPAFVAGGLLIPLTFVAARAVYAARAGVLAAALVAASTPLVLYATNARGYSLIGVAMLVAFLALRTAIERNEPRSWAVFACATAAGAAVNPSMLYPAGGLVLWAALELASARPVNRSRLRALLVACAASGAMAVVVYLPAIKVSGWRSVVANDYVRPLQWGVFARALPAFAADLAAYIGAGWPLVLGLGAGLALFAGWVLHRRIARDRWPVSLVMLGWAVVLMIAMRRVPSARVWLFLLPMLAASAGAGLELFLRSFRLAGLPVKAALLSLLIAAGAGAAVVHRRATNGITETGVFPDGARVADTLARVLQPGDMVAAQWRAQGPVDFYLRVRGTSARFAVRGDSVSGRLYVIPAWDLDETPASVIRARQLRGVTPSAAREVTAFSRASLWRLDPPPAPDEGPRTVRP